MNKTQKRNTTKFFAGIMIGICFNLALTVIAMGKSVPFWLVITNVIILIPLFLFPLHWEKELKR